jgi:hypothetical protein
MVTPSSLSFLAGASGAALRTPEANLPALGGTDSASLFGFTGAHSEARVLSVPPTSGDSPAQLQARFVDCLFTRA